MDILFLWKFIVNTTTMKVMGEHTYESYIFRNNRIIV